MSDASSDIESWIQKLRKLPRLMSELGPVVAEALKEAVAAKLNAGQAPDGSGWVSTKDGSQPFKGAAKKLVARSSGRVAILSFDDFHRFHHAGTSHVPERHLLPTKDIPEEALEEISKVTYEKIQERLK